MKKIILILILILVIPIVAYSDNIIEKGKASFYNLNGHLTASGEVFIAKELSAAHKTIPFGKKVKVTNLLNGKFVFVKINDRGPYKKGRIIDLSSEAAKQLGMIEKGVVIVKIEYNDSSI